MLTAIAGIDLPPPLKTLKLSSFEAFRQRKTGKRLAWSNSNGAQIGRRYCCVLYAALNFNYPGAGPIQRLCQAALLFDFNQ